MRRTPLYVVSGSGAGVQVIETRGRARSDKPVHAAAKRVAGGAGDTDMSDEYEWAPLRLPPDVTRLSAFHPAVHRGGVPRPGS